MNLFNGILFQHVTLLNPQQMGPSLYQLMEQQQNTRVSQISPLTVTSQELAKPTQIHGQGRTQHAVRITFRFILVNG